MRYIGLLVFFLIGFAATARGVYLWFTVVTAVNETGTFGTTTGGIGSAMASMVLVGWGIPVMLLTFLVEAIYYTASKRQTQLVMLKSQLRTIETHHERIVEALGARQFGQ